MKKAIFILSLITLLLVIGCQNVSDKEIELELENKSDYELDLIIEESELEEGEALVGQAYRKYSQRYSSKKKFTKNYYSFAKKVRAKRTYAIKSGTAKVYPNNPVSTPSLKLVQLKNLKMNGRLQGTYVKEVKNIVPGETSVFRSDNIFIFSPTEVKIYGDGTTGPYEGVRFGETMAYYCSDKLLSYLDKNFGGSFVVPKITIRVYDENAPGSAGYNFGDNSIAVKVPGNIDPNHDCTIYAHEIFHLFFLSNYNPSNDFKNKLTSAGDIYHTINEGFSHFLAASFQDILYQITAESIESLYSASSFDCDNDLVLSLASHELDFNCYDVSAQQCESNQKAIAGIFWDIREAIGKSDTHEIIFESWKYLPKSCSERQGENYLVDVFLALDQAEKDLFNNPTYHSAIKNAFVAHSEYFQIHTSSLPMVTPACS